MANEVGILVGDDVERLEHRVRRASEPLLTEPLLRRHHLDVEVEHRRQPPAARDVRVERVGLVLRQHLDLEQARVDQVRQHEVDEPIAAADRHRGLGAIGGERPQATPFTAGEDHREHVRRRPARREATRRGHTDSGRPVPFVDKRAGQAGCRSSTSERANSLQWPPCDSCESSTWRCSQQRSAPAATAASEPRAAPRRPRAAAPRRRTVLRSCRSAPPIRSPRPRTTRPSSGRPARSRSVRRRRRWRSPRCRTWSPTRPTGPPRALRWCARSSWASATTTRSSSGTSCARTTSSPPPASSTRARSSRSSAPRRCGRSSTRSRSATARPTRAGSTRASSSSRARAAPSSPRSPPA